MNRLYPGQKNNLSLAPWVLPADADRQGSLPRQRSTAGGYGHVARCAAELRQNEREGGGAGIGALPWPL